jgi:hypothetical protein
MTPAWAAGITGVPAAAHRGRPPSGGARGDRHAAARPRHRAAVQGCRQRPRGDQPRARHRQVRQARMWGHHDHRTGQRPGRPRARPQVRPAARQPRHHQPRAPRHVASVWGCDVDEIPGKGIPAEEIIEAIHAGEIKGLLSICFNPFVSSRTRTSRERRSTSSSSTASSTSSSPSPAITPTSSCPARSTRRTRAPHLGRGPDHQDQRRGRPRRARPGSTGRSSSTSPSVSAAASTSRTPNTTRSSRSSGRVRGRHRRLPRGDLGADRGRVRAVLADPREGPPGHAPPVRRRKFFHPDGKARFHADAVPAARRGGR